MPGDGLCVVCQSEMRSDQSDQSEQSDHVHMLACGHTFHTACILQWFRSLQSRCPLCLNAGGVELNREGEDRMYYHRADYAFRGEVKRYAAQNPAAPRWLKRLLLRESSLRVKETEAKRRRRELERSPVPLGTTFKAASKALGSMRAKLCSCSWEIAKLWRTIKCRVSIVPLTIIRRRHAVDADQAASPPSRRTSARLQALRLAPS
jgi:hypothetical protein